MSATASDSGPSRAPPGDALHAPGRGLPAKAAGGLIAGSEKMILKANALQRELGGVFDLACDRGSCGIPPAAQAADWGPIDDAGDLHDRASCRYCWTTVRRAHAAGTTLAPEVARAFL